MLSMCNEYRCSGICHSETFKNCSLSRHTHTHRTYWGLIDFDCADSVHSRETIEFQYFFFYLQELKSAKKIVTRRIYIYIYIYNICTEWVYGLEKFLNDKFRLVRYVPCSLSIYYDWCALLSVLSLNLYILQVHIECSIPSKQISSIIYKSIGYMQRRLCVLSCVVICMAQ